MGSQYVQQHVELSDWHPVLLVELVLVVQQIPEPAVFPLEVPWLRGLAFLFGLDQQKREQTQEMYLVGHGYFLTK